jgi:hypothetical protein
VITGRLDRLHLGDLMQWLTMGSLSGRLSLRDRAHERHVDFVEGRVVYASSTAPRERLATWLVESGLLEPDQGRRFLARSLLDRRLFTDVLIDEGVPAEAIHRLLRQLAATIVSRSLTHPELDFRFDEAYPVKDLLNVSLNIEPNSLLMEAARRLDEVPDDYADRDPAVLPFEGAAFEELFWDLIASSVPDSEPLGGSALAGIAETIRRVIRTLAHWLDSSPGLVPLPETQAESILDSAASSETVILEGRPQATWNQMVFAASVHGADIAVPETLSGLERAGADLGLWNAMASDDAWRRQAVQRLDDHTSAAARAWSRAAAAASPALGADPDTVRLAAHLVVVPTDLVLWALSSLSVEHRGLRAALLHQLPRRLGTGLARRAGFPESLATLFADQTPSPLGTALMVARDALPGGAVWLPTATEDPTELLLHFDRQQLTAAGEAAVAALEP